MQRVTSSRVWVGLTVATVTVSSPATSWSLTVTLATHSTVSETVGSASSGVHLGLNFDFLARCQVREVGGELTAVRDREQQRSGRGFRCRLVICDVNREGGLFPSKTDSGTDKPVIDMSESIGVGDRHRRSRRRHFFYRRYIEIGQFDRSAGGHLAVGVRQDGREHAAVLPLFDQGQCVVLSRCSW